MRLVLVLICGCLLSAGSTVLAQSVTRLEPVNAPIPTYPVMARAKRISGVVLVDVRVNRKGQVLEAIALLGGEYLRDAAVKAAHGWRFNALQAQSTDDYSVRLTFIFHDYSYKPPERKPDFRSPYQIEILYPEATADCFNDCP
jgi:TonB family protein